MSNLLKDIMHDIKTGTDPMERFVGFGSWTELLDHVESGYRLFYQAPLDYRPVQVSAVKQSKSGKVYVSPIYTDADSFTADEGHLSRFRKEKKS